MKVNSHANSFKTTKNQPHRTLIPFVTVFTIREHINLGLRTTMNSTHRTRGKTTRETSKDKRETPPSETGGGFEISDLPPFPPSGVDNGYS